MGIGIALAGGGIRGIAHAGVLKALEENRNKNRSNRWNKCWKYSCIFICNGI